MELGIHNKTDVFAQDDLVAAWLHFIRLPGIGSVKGAFFLQQNSIESLLNADTTTLKRLGWGEAQIQHWLQFDPVLYEKELAWAATENHYILTQDNPLYPTLLNQTVGAPLVLFVAGDPQCLSEQQIAIVGSRKPSKEGIAAAQYFSEELSKRQFCITSGLAQGIDISAHQSAMAMQGKTIAVQGCGLKHIYPSKHKILAQKIIEKGGALISEFFPDVAPKAEHFPRRNRIISGMSLGTIVIDAAERSGSLITARYALEQNREVFAVPNGFSSTNQGCNRLIQQGAKLVYQLDDVLEEFQTAVLPEKVEIQRSNECSQSNIIHSIPERDVSHLPFYKLLDNVRNEEPVSIDVIAEKSGLAVQEVMTALITFELEGLVVSVPGGYVRSRS